MSDENIADIVRQLEDLKRRLQVMETGAVPKGMSLIRRLDADAGAVASFDFTDIPQTFASLELVLSIRSVKAAASADVVYATFNGNTSANYYMEDLYAVSNNTPASFENRGVTSFQFATGTAASSVANSFGISKHLFPDYANANKLPAWLSTQYQLRATTTGNTIVEIRGGALNVAGALTRITLAFAANNIAQYSTARLYGVY